MNGPHYPLDMQLLGVLVDQGNVASWQRAHNPSIPKPRTDQWPWSKRDDQKTFGRAAPLEQVRDYLLWRNGRVPGR